MFPFTSSPKLSKYIYIKRYSFNSNPAHWHSTGSGGSSSLASSPSLRGSCAWPRPSSPVRPLLGDAPRSRLSLYEGTREMPTSAKTRHSMCLESQDQSETTRKQKNRHSICIEPRDLARTRASLCMEPRNPLLELMESVEAIPSLIPHDSLPLSSSRTSPSKSEGNIDEWFVNTMYRICDGRQLTCYTSPIRTLLTNADFFQVTGLAMRYQSHCVK